MKIKSLGRRSAFLAALVAFAALLPAPYSARAADHGDAPTVAHDQAADLADLYLFLDPNDNSQVVIIGTFRGFIVPGEAVNFAIFDPAIRYRFEIYNDHVNLPAPGPTATGDQIGQFQNRIVANKTIDVTFTQRTATPGPVGKESLQIPQPQQAIVQLTGFNGIAGDTRFTAPVTNPSLGATPPAQTITNLVDPTRATPIGVTFFAGEVDDPFFFDIPAFSAFIASVRNGAPNAGVFSRARDSFAGYNVLSIALRMPASFLRGTNGTIVGGNLLSQRHALQGPTENGEISGSGDFKTIDRTGVPAVNVVLVPFNQKNAYNVGSPKADAQGKFAGGIVSVLTALGTNAAHIGILANVAVTFGDILRLETNAVTKPNLGNGGGDNAGNGFPNGRRLKDDVVDTLLFLITNETLTTGDGVNASDVAPSNAFPFVQQSQQPRTAGVIDDNTRN